MNFPPSMENYIVRIKQQDQKTVVGTGLQVGEQYFLTCLHVINDAWSGVPEAIRKSSQAPVYFDFPLNERHKKKLEAKLLHCDAKEDLALLITKSKITLETQPVLFFNKIEDDTPIKTFGFPSYYSATDESTYAIQTSIKGKWAEGKVIGKVGEGNYQINAIDQHGAPITHGFSGAPVKDKTKNNILGLVVKQDTQEEERIAYMIPLSKIPEEWLKEIKYSNTKQSIDKTLHKIADFHDLFQGGYIMPSNCLEILFYLQGLESSLEEWSLPLIQKRQLQSTIATLKEDVRTFKSICLNTAAVNQPRKKSLRNDILDSLDQLRKQLH